LLRKVCYSAKHLERLSMGVLKRYAPETLCGEPIPTPIERLIEFDYGLYLCYMNLSKDGKTLGKTCFDDGYTKVYDRGKQQMVYIKVEKGTIIIEADLLSGHLRKLRFTQCHELAHWIGHRDILTETQRQPALIVETPDPEEKWIEWQANEIARNLLLPMQTVRPFFHFLKNKLRLSETDIIKEIMETYIVSKQTAAIQLHEHKLIKMDRHSLYLG